MSSFVLTTKVSPLECFVVYGTLVLILNNLNRLAEHMWLQINRLTEQVLQGK